MTDTKTIISGTGKNLEGLEWSNLADDYCPKCDGNLKEEGGYMVCEKGDFKINIPRYKEILESLENPEEEGYLSFDDIID